MFRPIFKGRNLNNFHFTNDPALTVTGKETTATSSLSLNKAGTRVDDDLLDFAISRTKFLWSFKSLIDDGSINTQWNREIWAFVAIPESKWEKLDNFSTVQYSIEQYITVEL